MNCCWQSAKWKLRLVLAHCANCRCRVPNNLNKRFFYDLMQFMKWSSRIISVKYGSIDRYILTLTASFVCFWIRNFIWKHDSYWIQALVRMAYRLIFCVLSVVYPMLWLLCYRWNREANKNGMNLPYLRAKNKIPNDICFLSFYFGKEKRAEYQRNEDSKKMCHLETVFVVARCTISWEFSFSEDYHRNWWANRNFAPIQNTHKFRKYFFNLIVKSMDFMKIDIKLGSKILDWKNVANTWWLVTMTYFRNWT